MGCSEHSGLIFGGVDRLSGLVVNLVVVFSFKV